MSYIHQHGIRAISAQRFDEASRSDDACWVVEEETLTIDVEGIGAYTLMWTPTEPVAAPCGFTPGDGVLAEGGVPEVLALAAGFAFTEGLFDRIGDIRSLAVCPENPGVVRLALADPRSPAPSAAAMAANAAPAPCWSTTNPRLACITLAARSRAGASRPSKARRAGAELARCSAPSTRSWARSAATARRAW
jgi:formate dehydrogenase assembly factor FdhD